MTLRARKAQMRQPVRLERIAAVVHMLAVVRRDPRARMVVQCAHESSHVAEQAVDRLHRAARPLGHRPCAQRRFSPLAASPVQHRAPSRAPLSAPASSPSRILQPLYNVCNIRYVNSTVKRCDESRQHLPFIFVTAHRRAKHGSPSKPLRNSTRTRGPTIGAEIVRIRKEFHP